MPYEIGKEGWQPPDDGEAIAEVEKYVIDNPAIGSFVLASILPWFLAPFPVFIFAIQWVFLVCVVSEAYKSYSGGCPNTGNSYTRALMTAISMLLFTRTIERNWDWVSKVSKVDIVPNSSWLQAVSIIDGIFEVIFSSAVLICNLWLVFGAETPVEMVLNSVALEFIGDLDNVYKMNTCKKMPLQILLNLDKQLKTQPVWRWYAAINHYFAGDQWASQIIWLLGAFFAFVVTPIGTLAIVFFGPVCKL
jgi:hypothetical protein